MRKHLNFKVLFGHFIRFLSTSFLMRNSGNSLFICLIPLMILPLHHLLLHFTLNITSVSSYVSSCHHGLFYVVSTTFRCVLRLKGNNYVQHFICRYIMDLWQNRVPLLVYIPFIIMPKLYLSLSFSSLLNC